jgi:GT2 family glycosyltransferase
MSKNLSLSVVIPTYQRPTWIVRAVRSLTTQVPPPNEIIVVVRDTDGPSHLVVDELVGSPLPSRIRKGVVAEPGFMPPVQEGLRLAAGDVVAVMDDDAEAQEAWASALLTPYRDPTVGAVGGRCINMEGETVAPVGETSRVGYVSVLGRFVGNMYKRPTFNSPVDVQFLMGGCMSFRRDVAKALEFDRGLNRNVASGYEVDLGLQVRNMGLRVVFAPSVAIRHYSAPRELAGQRVPDDTTGVYWAAYNQTRVALRRLPTPLAIIALSWGVVMGERRAPGGIPWLLGPLSRTLGYRTQVAGAALRGRSNAVRDLVRESWRSNPARR